MDVLLKVIKLGEREIYSEKGDTVVKYSDIWPSIWVEGQTKEEIAERSMIGTKGGHPKTNRGWIRPST